MISPLRSGFGFPPQSSLTIATRPFLQNLFFFFLMIRRPRRSPLFPYPPLFRSQHGAAEGAGTAGAPVRRDAEAAPLRACERLPAPAARGRPAQRPAAAARCDPRAAARRARA